MTRNFIRSEFVRRAGMPAAVATVLLAIVLLATGCGGAGSPGQAAGPATSTGSKAAVGVVLNVTGAVYSYTPKALKAAAGQTTIRFTNKGVVEHDFVIKALGVKLHAQPGKTVETDVTLKPGSYKTVCTIPGHLQNGMEGTLTVS